MPQAVRFDQYGGIDVLRVADVERPVPGPREVLVRVKATSINPGEAKIRSGALAEQWPATFPSGEGSDLAGIVDEQPSGAGRVRARRCRASRAQAGRRVLGGRRVDVRGRRDRVRDGPSRLG